MNSLIQNNFLSLLALDRKQNEIHFKKSEIEKIEIKTTSKKSISKLNALPTAVWNGCVKTSFDLIKLVFIGIPFSLKNSFYLKKYCFTFVRHCQNSFGRIVFIFNKKIGIHHIRQSENYLKYYEFTDLLNDKVMPSIDPKLKTTIDLFSEKISKFIYVEKLKNLKVDSKNEFSTWMQKIYLKDDENNVTRFTINLLKEILNLQKITLDDSGLIKFGKFNLKNLNSEEIILLYQILKTYHESSPNNIIVKTIIFNIEDHCYKLCLNEKNKNPNQATQILKHLKTENNKNFEELILAMERLLNPQTHTSFHSLVPEDNQSELTTIKKSKIALHPLSNTTTKKRPLKVLKLAVESRRNHVGGISSVLNASSEAHKSMNLEKVFGIHPFYCHDKLNFQVKFIGVIKHQFKGKMVQSSIYKDIEKNEFLVEPDDSYKSLFNVGNSKSVYNSFEYSLVSERSAYMSSAAASFTALYTGKNGNKAIDIVQSDGPHVGGLGFDLLNSTIDPILQKANLPLPKRIFLTHGLMGPRFQGHCSKNVLKEIGGETKNYPSHLNLTAIGLTHSHLNVFVSKGVSQDAVSDSIKLNTNLQKETLSKGINKVKAITNGINTSIHDPCNPEQFGELALKRTYESGIETTDFVAHQNKIKQLLYENKVIPDAKKPLFVFVGRFSREKGINMLPSMVQEVKKQGGQCVIMGINCNSFLSNRTINSLKKLARKNPGFLRVYDQPIDQQGHLYDLQNQPLYEIKKDKYVQRGSLIRAAASVMVVPSHSEACGLVPMEAHCSGALVVAPYIQGLKDMCIPLNSTNEKGEKLGLLNGANAVCYEDSNSKNQIRNAVAEAYKSITSLSDKERNQYMLKMNTMSKSSYSWYHKNETTKVISGAAFEYSKTYHELLHEDKMHPNVETFEEAIERSSL